jgi:hypothetical protein
MIPKSRLDAVIAEREAARQEATALKAQQAKAQQDALTEQGRWKELAETRAAELLTANEKVKRMEEYELTLKETLASQLTELAPDVQAIVPEELTTAQKLKWLAKNKATLLKPPAPDIGAGTRGGGKPESKIDLTPEQLQVAKQFGYSPEEYAKFATTTPEPFSK